MRTSIVELKNKRQERGQHAGLLLQRYLTENATGKEGNPDEKQAILQAAIAAASNHEVRELYKAAYERWTTSVDASTVQNMLQVSGRLIVGLGSENVLETGIRLHHTYGMPLIPGSALKGLAAHYCDQVWGQRDLDTPSGSAVKFRGSRPEVRKENRSAEKQGEYHALLFGSTDESGCIVFHDGWLKADSEKEPLKLDVMTPHHPKWLDGSVPPTDFDSPIPVPFLSVVGTFQIAVSWHGPPSDHSQQWTQLAYDLVAEALSKWGIGGKTTSGYGRLVDPAAARSSGEASGVGDAISRGPVHEPRERVQVIQRTINGKIRYEADDGFLGSLIQGTPPNVPDGESISLWIQRVDVQNKVPYVFQIDEPHPPKQQSPRKNSGGGKGKR